MIRTLPRILVRIRTQFQILILTRGIWTQVRNRVTKKAPFLLFGRWHINNICKISDKDNRSKLVAKLSRQNAVVSLCGKEGMKPDSPKPALLDKKSNLFALKMSKQTLRRKQVRRETIRRLLMSRRRNPNRDIRLKSSNPHHGER